MSIQNPAQYDLEAAYYAGLRGFQGDPEVAEDLGIATSPESFMSHLESAKTVKGALGEAATQNTVEVLQQGINLGNYAAVLPTQKEINRLGVERVRKALKEGRNASTKK